MASQRIGGAVVGVAMAAASYRRDRPPASARGDGTRQQLIDAALRLFSAHGYDAVTMRALAREAAVNLAAANYHFGGKQGLYRAVLEDIAERMSARLTPTAGTVGAKLRDAGDDRRALASALSTLLRTIIEAFVGETVERPTAVLVVREYARPSPGFDAIYNGVALPLHHALCAIVGAARERPATDAEIVLQAHALLGQCLGFAVARPVVCRRMGWTSYSPQHLDQIVAAVTVTALGALDLPASEGT